MLTDEQLLSSPVIRNIASRVRANGYAKTAAAVIFNGASPELPLMLAQIGTKIAQDMHRQQQIRIGLASLETLTEDRVKHANFLANILKRGQGAAGAAAHSAVPEAEQLTHLLAGSSGIPALAPKSIAQVFPEHALEIPAYARQVSEGGTFVPREMPVASKEVPKAPEGMKTKTRPTQKMDLPELPSMFRSGSLERGGQMGSGGKGIMAGADAAPQGVGSFGAPQGSAEAPAMFNLAELMKGNKTAAWLKAAGIDLKTLMGAAKPMAEEWRSVPNLLRNVPSATPLSPKLQSAIQSAHAPSPFSSLQPVPQQHELAALMAGNKLANAVPWQHALVGALPSGFPVAALGAITSENLKDPEQRSNARKVMGAQLGGTLAGSALGSAPGLFLRNPELALMGSMAGGGLGAMGTSTLLQGTDAGKQMRQDVRNSIGAV